MNKSDDVGGNDNNDGIDVASRAFAVGMQSVLLIGTSCKCGS